MLEVLKAVFALAATLGLFGVGVYLARRWGPSSLFKLRPSTTRRLAVVETLAFDTKTRLVLVRVDQVEKLVLLGEGRIVDAPMAGEGVA